MKIAVLSCCICLLLTSCGLSPAVSTIDTIDRDQPAGIGGRLLNIRIERWGTVRFSGLLGLKELAGGVYYVLLDATGIKLLEVEVARDGGHKVLQVSGPVKKTELAPFLSEALARIYLQEPGPGQEPCVGSWFYRLCRAESKDQSWGKYGQAGPFKVWQVSGHSPGNDEATVVYRQPWLGVSITLLRMAQGK